MAGNIFLFRSQSVFGVLIFIKTEIEIHSILLLKEGFAG